MFLAQQHTGTAGGSVPIGGGVVHPTSSNNPVAASVPHGVGTGSIAHHSGSAVNHSSSLLWTKTQQLPEEVFRQVSGQLPSNNDYIYIFIYNICLDKCNIF